MVKGSVRQILTRAAERIDAGMNFQCCIAISEAESYDRIGDCLAFLAADNHFFDLYSPFRDEFGATEFWSKRPTPARQRLRVLALLFAAASYEGP